MTAACAGAALCREALLPEHLITASESWRSFLKKSFWSAISGISRNGRNYGTQSVTSALVHADNTKTKSRNLCSGVLINLRQVLCVTADVSEGVITNSTSSDSFSRRVIEKHHRNLHFTEWKAADEMYLQKCWNRNRISARQILMEMQQKCSSSFCRPPSKVDQAGIEVGFHSQDLQRQGMGSFGNWKDESSNLVLMSSNAKLHHTLPFGCSNFVPGGRQLLCTASRGRTYSTFAEKEFEEDDTGGQQASLPIQEERSGGGQQSSLENPDSKPSSTMSSWPNPDNAASYVLMSNIYADGDRWDEAKRINEMRLKARAWKKPGKAYVEIKAKVHEFIVGDRTHQDSVNIYEKLRKIKRHMGHIGYVPYVDLVLENRSYYDPYAKPR